MVEYRFILRNAMTNKEESKVMSVDTPYNAIKYACWWIRGKGIDKLLSPYYVMIQRLYNGGGLEYYEYFDTVSYTGGRFVRDSGKAVNPDTGRPIVKKKGTAHPFGL